MALSVQRALQTKNTEDEEKEGNAENGDKTRDLDGRLAPVEVQTCTSLGDTTVGQEGPKERERRHVPGGKWLSQDYNQVHTLAHKVSELPGTNHIKADYKADGKSPLSRATAEMEMEEEEDLIFTTAAKYDLQDPAGPLNGGRGKRQAV
ncbi:hypothetical protein NDU88_005934 [Pleurodeles waltl]|uniref:Uncharacterized protein n=1 Tax=Pleurodeles waltl TaxID=8319 RepID=A0AAV7VPE3_PLEWA|nr:hypothetical protein NDU88_005934 [Pleurodeles waltl]